MSKRYKIALIVLGTASGYVLAQKFIFTVDLRKANRADKALRRWSR
jgi:hypothetical protein